MCPFPLFDNLNHFTKHLFTPVDLVPFRVDICIREAVHGSGGQLHWHFHARFGTYVEESIITYVVDTKVKGWVLFRIL